MNTDYRLVLKMGVTGVLSFYLVHYLKELVNSIKDSQQIFKKEVNSLTEIQNIIQSKEKSRLNLVKLKPYYLQPLRLSLKIRSAQKLKFEPSDKDVVSYFTRILSRSIGNKIYIEKIPFEWFAKAQNSTKYKYHRIHGLGHIKSDFFELKRQFEPIKKLNYWTRFRNWIAKQFVRILPRSNEVGTHKHTRPFFLGPVIGYLNYELTLMKDTHIVALCTIQDGNIIPSVTALSKSDILTFFERKIEKNYLKVAGFLVVTIVMARWLWSDIKIILNTLKIKKQRLTSTYFNPEVSDDKICIICYANCRNMIFFDCRHMIMCRQCSQKYESDTCPYCKLEIDEIRIVSGVK